MLIMERLRTGGRKERAGLEKGSDKAMTNPHDEKYKNNYRSNGTRRFTLRGHSSWCGSRCFPLSLLTGIRIVGVRSVVYLKKIKCLLPSFFFFSVCVWVYSVEQNFIIGDIGTTQEKIGRGEQGEGKGVTGLIQGLTHCKYRNGTERNGTEQVEGQDFSNICDSKSSRTRCLQNVYFLFLFSANDMDRRAAKFGPQINNTWEFYVPEFNYSFWN